MKSFTNIVSFVLLATAGNVMSNVIRRAPLPETETVLFKSNTTLNLDGLKARQLSIPSLTLCQNSNCEGPCYTYYLGGDGNGVCYSAIGVNPSGYVLSSAPTAWEILAGGCPGAWLEEINTCYNIFPSATHYEVIY